MVAIASLWGQINPPSLWKSTATDWRCYYCGSTNEEKTRRCKGCNSPKTPQLAALSECRAFCASEGARCRVYLDDRDVSDNVVAFWGHQEPRVKVSGCADMVKTLNGQMVFDPTQKPIIARYKGTIWWEPL